LLLSRAEEFHAEAAETFVQEATLVLPQFSVRVHDSCNTKKERREQRLSGESEQPTR